MTLSSLDVPSRYRPANSYLRTAAASVTVAVADVPTNVERIRTLYEQAVQRAVSLTVFPELCITGYTLGDLVQQTRLLKQAGQGCLELAKATAGQPTAMVVGLPLQVGNSLYNCAALLADGRVWGLVPKTYRPTYGEFYEQRWYETWDGPATNVTLGGVTVPFGTGLLFRIGGVLCGLEICEDVWVPQPPSVALARHGALVIANPSASPEQVGKAAYRRQLLAAHSARLFVAYLYAACDCSESTAEVVMGGHQLIACSGQTAAERMPFEAAGLTVADIDIEHLELDRRRQHMPYTPDALVIETGIKRQQRDLLTHIDRNPFLPDEGPADRTERMETVLDIQAHGLVGRLQASKQPRLVLGLSGGLDSTLALLVACRAAGIMRTSAHALIHTLTMPGPASSGQTQQNAQAMARALHVRNTLMPIDPLVRQELSILGHDGATQDITYENVQARARTALLFNYANQHNALVLGTGDLSEIALGWCTYNGDQQSHYSVNSGIPKTMVRALVAYLATQPEYAAARTALATVLGTVISPELTRTVGDTISQSTEGLVGPYELHDFFLYYLVRRGDTPAKIQYLAQQAFAGDYTSAEIKKWLRVFTRRFAANQFKRDNLPNGPKVSSVSLSPRGDWRMPSDLPSVALWQ